MKCKDQVKESKYQPNSSHAILLFCFLVILFSPSVTATAMPTTGLRCICPNTDSLNDDYWTEKECFIVGGVNDWCINSKKAYCITLGMDSVFIKDCENRCLDCEVDCEAVNITC
ncbi:hypothetical protein EDD21DRAFT_68433 [Dissophora ornata]|nr:hypothetical protein EDD21DRAFT_68433 [Dissophora ornata]